MRFVITLLFLMVGFVSFCQQDSLFISKNDVIKGEITGIIGDTIVIIGENNIIYRIDKKDVHGVVFADAESAYKFEFSELKEKNNLISLDVLLPILDTELVLYYERYFLKGYFSVRTSFNYNLDYESFSSNIDRYYSVGIDLLYYPTGQGKYKYFCGPGVEWGMFDRAYFSDPQTMKLNREDYYFIYLNNGILYQITRQLNVGFSFGFGLRNNSNAHFYDELHRYYNFKTNLGYRF